MIIHIFEGNPNGISNHIATLDENITLASLPCHGELICINEEFYKVNTIIHNYDKNEVDIFIKLYDWE